MSAIVLGSATAEQSPISYEEETHTNTNAQQTALTTRSQSTGAGLELLMQEDASRRATIHNKSTNNVDLYDKIQKYSHIGSPKAALIIQHMQENVRASMTSFNVTNDSNQLYYTIDQMHYLLKAQLELDDIDAFDTAAMVRQLTLRVTTGDLKEMLLGSNPLQLMKDLLEIELSYRSLSSYLDQDLKTFITLAENYRKADPSEGEFIDELFVSLIESSYLFESSYPYKETLTLILSGIQDPSHHLEGQVIALKKTYFMYGFEERENVLKELLNKAETMSHLSPRIALRIFECSISIFGKKDSEPVLIKAKALARKLQGEERDEAFRMIIECEMKYNLPSALGTYNELKSFSE